MVKTTAEKEAIRAKKEAKEIKLFAQKIKEAYPLMPNADVNNCACHACETGSGRVGRSTVVNAAVELAVRAYVRHNYTEYDQLVPQVGKDAARSLVVDFVLSKCNLWENN